MQPGAMIQVVGTSFIVIGVRVEVHDRQVR
jgi:hypothetical protein